MTEQELINFWKSNEKPFGLCPKEAQEWLRQFDGHCLLYVLSGEWVSFDSKTFTSVCVYRLPPDYQPEKRGRWVECEVKTNPACPLQYDFAVPGDRSGARMFLHAAPGMVGFGGVEYEGWGWEDVLGAITKDGKICKPIRVKFWVEG